MTIRRETAGGMPHLEGALAERGLVVKVESRAGLCVLIADADTVAKLSHVELRRSALALAKEYGFTHVAIELRATP